MSNKRLLWADNLKGFLILLVVLGHTIQYSVSDFDSSHVFNYIYSFHMPLFMLMSGFCSYKPAEKVNWGGVGKRAIQLLIPYFVWTPIFCWTTGMPIFRGLYEIPVYWFLILLFFISLIMIACQMIAVRTGWMSEVICGVAVVALFAMQALFKPDVLSLNILHIHFFFYTMGWYFRKYDCALLHNWMIAPLGIMTIILGWYYNRGSSPSFLSFMPPILYFTMSGIAGSLFFMALFRRFADKECGIMSQISRMTLGIYVIHIVICGNTGFLMHQIAERIGYGVSIAILFVIMTFVSVMLSILMGKSSLTRMAIGLK